MPATQSLRLSSAPLPPSSFSSFKWPHFLTLLHLKADDTEWNSSGGCMCGSAQKYLWILNEAGCRAQESWDWCQFNGGQVSPQHWQTRGRTQRLHDGACQSQSPCGRASPPKWLCQHPCSQGGPCCLLPLSEPSEISKGLWPESFQIIASVLGLRFWVYSIRAESLLVFVYLFCLFFNIYSFGHTRS